MNNYKTSKTKKKSNKMNKVTNMKKKRKINLHPLLIKKRGGERITKVCKFSFQNTKENNIC